MSDDRNAPATKGDIEDLRTKVTDLRTEVKDLRTEVKDLRTEVKDLRTEVKAELTDLRAEVKADLTDLRAEVKAELTDLRAEVKEQISTVRSEITEQAAMIRSEMQHTFDDLKETIHDAQTGLLQAFYSFAESNQTRLTQAEKDSAALKERMALYEQRLTDLERKVNFPNNPPRTQ